MSSGGKLYTTESGQLFHAGKIAICLVGLPARGKTHLSVSLCRYLTWLGLTCKAFHLGDYRRKRLQGADMPDDYFFFHSSEWTYLSYLRCSNSSRDVSDDTRVLRDQVAGDCMRDILEFMSRKGENGQIVIYDAVNASISVRSRLHQEFSQAGIQTIFVESVCTDNKIIQANVRNVKVTSPDYEGWESQRAVEDYLRRITAKIPHYEEMSREKEPNLSWVKMINIGERMVVNKGSSALKGQSVKAQGNFGYLGASPDGYRAVLIFQVRE